MHKGLPPNVSDDEIDGWVKKALERSSKELIDSPVLFEEGEGMECPDVEDRLIG